MSSGFPLPPWGLPPPSTLVLPRPSDPLSPSRFGGGGSGRPDSTLGQSHRLENCVWTIRSRGPGRGREGGAREEREEWRHHAETGTHTRWGSHWGVGVHVWVGYTGSECLEWEVGRSLFQESKVNEGDGEEREEEGAERSPLSVGNERDTERGGRGQLETLMDVLSPPELRLPDLGCGCQGVACLWDKWVPSPPTPVPPYFPVLSFSPWPVLMWAPESISADPPPLPPPLSSPLPPALSSPFHRLVHSPNPGPLP